MSYCPNCGKEVENVLFCPECGTKIEDTTKEKGKRKPPKKSNSKKPLIATAIVCVLVLVGCLTYYLYSNGYIFTREIFIDNSVEENHSIVADCSSVYTWVHDDATAYQALDSVSSLYGFDSAEDEFNIERRDNVDGDVYYRFAQKYKDVPVYGKSMVLGTDDIGNVFNISGNYEKIENDIDLTPQLDEDEVQQKITDIVSKELKKGLEISEPELVVYCGTGTPTLSYKFAIAGYNKKNCFKSYCIFVDANTCKILDSRNTTNLSYTSKTLSGQDDTKQEIQLDKSVENGDIVYKCFDEKRNIYVYIPVDKYYWYMGENKENEDEYRKLVTWNEDEEADKSAVDALANLSKVYDYFYDTLKHKGISGNGEPIAAYIHVEDMNYENGESTDRGIWIDTGNAFQDEYNNNSYIAFTKPIDGYNESSVYLDTVAHEYAHGVSGKIANFSSCLDKTMNGALNEAYSDILGILVKDVYDANGTDWIHGERSLKSPTGEYLSVYDENYEITEAIDCYYLSTIISHSAYLMWKGTSDESSAIEDTRTLAKLWYDSMYMLNQDSDFEDCRVAVETSAQRLVAKNLLTAEQLEGVYAAFDQAGISKKVAYEIVRPNPTLNVWAANNTAYFNYHYTVKKLSAENLYSVGKQVEVKTDIIDEGDITDEAEVVLKSLTSDENTAYIITITDLNDDEPGTEQTKWIFVGKDTDTTAINFLTDFKPASDKLIKNVNSALDGVDSLHTFAKTNSDLSVDGHRISVNTTMKSDVNYAEGINHCVVTTEYDSTSVTNDMYIKTNQDMSDIYMQSSGIWVKQNVSNDKLYKLGKGVDGRDGIKFYLNAMDNVYMEETTLDEKSVYLLSGSISSENTEEIFKLVGMDSIMDSLMSEDIDEETIKGWFSSLNPIVVTFYIDKETYLPIKLDLDMTSMTDSVIGKIADWWKKEYSEKVSYKIYTNSATLNFSEYNSVESITIPSDAYNGRDYKIIR